MKNLRNTIKRRLMGLHRVLGPVCLVAVFLLGSMSITEPAQSKDSSLAGTSPKLNYLPQCRSNEIDCGDRWCCKSDQLCCGNGVCCSSDKPHYCPSTKKCYKYKVDADEACGKDNWVLCWRPA